MGEDGTDSEHNTGQSRFSSDLAVAADPSRSASYNRQPMGGFRACAIRGNKFCYLHFQQFQKSDLLQRGGLGGLGGDGIAL
ncbi:hypothetical protein MY4824_003432 [Beauveria thailandica]